MKKNNNAFTLVELIIVISILTILGTISIINFQGHVKDARNSTRITDMNSINQFINIYSEVNSNYPNVSSGEIISYSGSEVWTQGVYGSQTQKTMGGKYQLHTLPKDPLFNKEYIYSITKNKKEYQIAGFLESDSSSISNSESGIPKIIGNYNGLISQVSTGSTYYLLASPSIITTNLSISLDSIVQQDKILYNGVKSGDKLVNYPSFILYSGSLSSFHLYKNYSNLLTNLESAYSGTIVENRVSELNKVYSKIGGKVDNSILIVDYLLGIGVALDYLLKIDFHDFTDLSEYQNIAVIEGVQSYLGISNSFPSNLYAKVNQPYAGDAKIYLKPGIKIIPKNWIGDIIINHKWVARKRFFKIQTSFDGINWIDRYEEGSEYSGFPLTEVSIWSNEDKNMFSEPAYIRLWYQNNAGNWPYLTQIEEFLVTNGK